MAVSDGCAISRCPPLCVIDKRSQHVHPEIGLHLDEPMLGKIDMKRLVGYCAFADMLVQMDLRTKRGTHFDEQVLQEIQRMCYRIASGKSYMSFLRESGIFGCFPHLRRFLEGDKACDMRSLKCFETEKDYFAYLALLNQLLVMSGQICGDISQPQNHKYMAHQVALLYQCINHVKGEVKPLEKRVEERFNGLKHLIENKNAARLTDFYKRWMRDLTDDIRTIVASFPPDIYSNVGQPQNHKYMVSIVKGEVKPLETRLETQQLIE